MNFIVEDKKDLVKKIALNIKAIEKNTMISSLSNLKLEVKDSTLIITSFDGSNCVVSKININNLSGLNKSIMIDSNHLKNIVDRLSKLSSSDIKFELLEDTSELSIKSGRMKLKIKVILDTGDFNTVPKIEEFKEYNSVVFTKDELIKSVSNIAKCSKKDTTQPILEAINIVVNEDYADIVALDGYRLGLNILECSSSGNFKISASATRLKDVLGDVALSDADVVELKSNGKYVLIQSGEINVFIREIEGSLAPYKRLLTKNFLYEIVVQKEDIIWALNSAMMATSKDNKIVRLTLNPGESFVEFKSSGDIITDLVNEIDMTINLSEEDNLEIAFNATYLVDLINNIKTKSVKMYFKDSVSPVYIENEDSEDSLEKDSYLVLPVRIRG